MMRVYNVPLKKAWRRKKSRRAEAAARFLRAFVARHMKVGPEQVKIDEEVNRKIWERSMNNPPRKLRIVAEKGEDGIVRVRLFKGEEGGGSKEEPHEKS